MEEFKHIIISTGGWCYLYPWHTLKRGNIDKVPQFVLEMMTDDGMYINVGAVRVKQKFAVAVAARWRYFPLGFIRS